MRAFITGVTGQDGFYLSELLLEKGYEVYGLVRRTSQKKQSPPGIIEVPGDVTDPGIVSQVAEIKPDEIYNLAAMSFVWESFKIPKSTFDINALGALNMLEAARMVGAKFYQASTSELYGSTPPPQDEGSPFHPRSPYGVSKLAAYWLTVNYREAYGLYAVNGVLFNHESPLRSDHFVTQKVAKYCAKPSGILKLGNLNAVRDWGHAKDFVNGMWLMLQQDNPDDYVLATGEGRTVGELLDAAFGYVGIDDWGPHVAVDEEHYRPSEVHALIGDASKAESLGWERKYTFEQMIGEMIDANRHG